MPESSPAQTLYGDLDDEIAITRRMLERYPSGKAEWRPHEKSMTIGRLAAHLAAVPGYATMLLTTDGADFGAPSSAPKSLDSAAELLALYDANAAEARARIAEADDDALARTWTARHGEHVVFAAPKRDLIRRMVLSHMIHHRAQLGTYYRLLDIPVPSTYGPSADEAI